MAAKARLLIALFALLTLHSSGMGQANEQPPSPQTIINRMAERYAALSSYRDTGVVETLVDGALPRRSTDISFKTFFTRPLKFRFEWADLSSSFLPDRNVVWSDGSKTFSYYSFEPGKIETKEDLGMGIAGATGVSLGSAMTVPNLLIKEVGGFSLTELTKLSLKGQERFEGEECYLLEGSHPSNDVWQLWIGKNDFLLRKLRTKRSNGEFEEEIHRDIQVNSSISEETYHAKLMSGGHLASTLGKEKEANIRHLLELIIPRERVNQMLNDVIGLMKQAMPQVPEKAWQEVVAELHLNSELVLQSYIPIYDFYYTDAEIGQLIAFYESPLGKKVTMNSSLIELEAAHQGEGIGRELIKRINERLRAKGYNAA